MNLIHTDLRPHAVWLGLYGERERERESFAAVFYCCCDSDGVSPGRVYMKHQLSIQCEFKSQSIHSISTKITDMRPVNHVGTTLTLRNAVQRSVSNHDFIQSALKKRNLKHLYESFL